MKPQNNQDNLLKCVCPACPLFTECNKGKSEKLFCATTISACQMDARKFCHCGACPVYSENDLGGGYFCLNELKK